MSPSGPQLWHRMMALGPGGSWPTEALGLAAASSPAALQLLVVPGNPGLASFYTPFLCALHDLFGGRADVWAVSNLGHDGRNATRGRVWCLDTQVDHKAALLREHVLAPGRPPAVVIAHSIGAHMVLQAVRRLEQEAEGDEARAARLRSQIPKVLLLMPFLATDWSSTRQHALRLAAQVGPVVAAAASLAGRLPARLQQVLVGLVQPGAEPHARRCMLELLNRPGVRNNLHLAWHEFRDLDRPVDWVLMARLGRRLAVVSAPDDMWWPHHHHADMQAALPGIEEHFYKELDHAFCCSTQQSQLVARVVLASVQQALAWPHPARSQPAGVAGTGGRRPAGAAAGAAAAAAAAADMSVLLGDEGGGDADKARARM